MSDSPKDQFSAQPLPQPGAQQPAPLEVTDEAYLYALDCLLKGSKPAEVRRLLLDSGYTARQADKIVQTAMQYRNDHDAANAANVDSEGNSGTRNMVIGGIVCLIGVAVTLGTMSAASGGGGKYIVAWGAIVFGAIQFFRGLSQMNR